MTNNNKFIYFSGVQVEMTKGENYKVTLEDEEYIIYVPSKDVNRISKEADEREELIAIVFAYIESVYQSTNVKYEKIQRLTEDVISDNVTVILAHMTAEEMIGIIKTLKWHEIFDVFQSENPVQRIRDLK